MGKKVIFFLFVCVLVHSISMAEEKRLSHHIDLMQMGTVIRGSYGNEPDRPLAGIAGYHFTILEKGRLSTLGLGFGWSGVNGTDKIPQYQDVALVAPLLNIKLQDKPERLPSVFFDINYGYSIIHKEHGIYLGFSLSSK